MITQLTGLPNNVIGFEATGTVTRKDYETLLFQAVKALATQITKLRFLYVVATGPYHYIVSAMGVI